MILEDQEFGEVIVRKNAWVKGVRFSISPSGRLQMTVSPRLPKILIKKYLDLDRARIRKTLPVNDPSTQRARDYQEKLMRKKAREYLPYRLEYYANLYSYKYDKCKLTHPSTRWGSCTHRRRKGSTKDEITISLNIGLMKVPEVLRDYVIIHELAHINNPDHSKAFWAEVASHDKNYKNHDRKLKFFTPGV